MEFTAFFYDKIHTSYKKKDLNFIFFFTFIKKLCAFYLSHAIIGKHKKWRTL